MPASCLGTTGVGCSDDVNNEALYDLILELKCRSGGCEIEIVERDNLISNMRFGKLIQLVVSG